MYIIIVDNIMIIINMPWAVKAVSIGDKKDDKKDDKG